MICQVYLFIFYLSSDKIDLMLSLLYILVSLANSFLAYRLLRSFLKYRQKTISKNNFKLDEMPSVSVLIPARNEQTAMTECLERVLSSSYPKMEIIVLDDNSVDNTSDRVKAFAHSGVRFIRGEEPPEGWLGRNYAYERLSSEASGDYLLFLSVDTKISRNTINLMASFILNNKAKMLSILPSRNDNYRASVLFSTLRYYLELILGRHSNPPSSSGAWMIERETLIDQLNGFTKYRQAIMPESEIAKTLNIEDGELFEVENPHYRFVIDEGKFGVNFEKKWSSQIQTEQRNFALRIFKNPSIILLILPFLTLHFLPFAIVTAKTVMNQFDTIFALYLLQVIFSVLIYGCYTSLVWSRGAWLGALLYPVIILQEICIFIYGIYRRFFGRMVWRGREIDFRKF